MDDTILRIDYKLYNLEETLKQNISSISLVWIYFERKYNDKSKLNKPTKENILKLKDKLENIEKVFEVKFKDCLVYKELLFLCENLKIDILNLHNCTLQERTEKKILNFINNCEFVKVYKKLDKILFHVIKNHYCIKIKDKNIIFDNLEYKSMKNIFFGMYLNILDLRNLETNEIEMRKLLKSLHGTVSLRTLIYDNKESYGLLYHRIKSKNKKEKPNKNIVQLKDKNEKKFGLIYNRKKKFILNIRKPSLNFKFNVEKANDLFLISLPNWINEVQIKSNYKQEDFKYLVSKFYNGGILTKNILFLKYFSKVTKQTDIDLLKYMTKIR